MRDKIEKYFVPILMGLTAVLITILGILFKQSPFRILPLYVSLVISMLQSRVNRYAPLIGSINSLVYGAVYLHYGLYASMANAILVSCPLQMITFLNWKKKAWKDSTLLKKLTKKQRICAGTGMVVIWGIAVGVLTLIGSTQTLLDTATTVISLAATVLMMLSYVEYAPLTLAGNLVSVGLYTAMLKETPEQSTYLAYSVYGCICLVIACFKTNQYLAQQNGQQ